jgi:hypothetical protein
MEVDYDMGVQSNIFHRLVVSVSGRTRTLQEVRHALTHSDFSTSNDGFDMTQGGALCGRQPIKVLIVWFHVACFSRPGELPCNRRPVLLYNISTFHLEGAGDDETCSTGVVMDLGRSPALRPVASAAGERRPL